MVRDLDFASLCEHHLVPFTGKVSIAYLPSGKVLGLSKFARITSIFARRLQVQEQLGLDIAGALESVLAPRGLVVHIVSTHMCMSMRGVEQRDSCTVTTAFRGAFKEVCPPLLFDYNLGLLEFVIVFVCCHVLLSV